MSDSPSTIKKKRLTIGITRTEQLLTIVHSPDPRALGRTLSLNGNRWELGRAKKASGPINPELIFDPSISSRHARISPDPQTGFAQIEDLDSANGTFVDGFPIQKGKLLPGQVLVLGDTVFVVDENPEPEALPVSETAPDPVLPEIIGSSLTTQQLRCSIATVSKSKGSVLLLGPTGVGKEVAARAIHELSGRSGEFVAVNCAAIPVHIAEAEFFGYRKGAFTGAETDKIGHVSRASGGTLFLDELGDLESQVQAKLLRALEEGAVQRLGATETESVDLRVVAATSLDLSATGFRQDLFARLADWTLKIPALKKHRADIIELFVHFNAQNPRRISPEFVEGLLLHDFPMNIRELKKLAVRLGELTRPDTILDLKHLPDTIQRLIIERRQQESAASNNTEDSDKGPATSFLDEALRKHKGNVTRIAAEHGWHRTQLYRWIRKAGLDPSQYR